MQVAMSTTIHEALSPKQRKVFALGAHCLRQLSAGREHYELVLVPLPKSMWNRRKRARRLQRLARRVSR